MQRNGRGANARREALSFEDAQGADASLTSREGSSRAETSHVARRRLVSEPTEEVSLDEVVLVDEPPSAPRTSSSMPSLPTPVPGSFAPLAMDVAPASAPFDVPIARGPLERPKRAFAIAPLAPMLAVGALAGVIAVFALRGSPAPAPIAGSASTSTTTTITLTPTLTIEAENTAITRPGEIPHVDVASLPRARVGTVVGLAEHRLWIDGKLQESFKGLVDCGPHLVQVGSAGALRKVDVPCGDEIVVTP